MAGGGSGWSFCYYQQDNVRLNALRAQLQQVMHPSLNFIPAESLQTADSDVVSMAEEADEQCGLHLPCESSSPTRSCSQARASTSVVFAHPNDKRKGQFTWYLLFSVLTCILGSSFQIGYHTGVVNTPETPVRSWIRDSHYRMWNSSMSEQSNTLVWSMTVSVFSVGGCVGAYASGWLADNCGRRGGLLLNNMFVVTACLLMFSCKYGHMYWLLVCGRFIIGINSGLSSALAPMYLNEISPRKLRGKLGTSHQLAVTLSILLAQTLGMDWAFGNEQHWHWLFGVSVALAVLQLVALPFCPETPVYNVLFRANMVQAERDLCRLRGRQDVYNELRHMQVIADRSLMVRQVSLSKMFTDRVLAWPLVIAVLMMCSQQFSGINAIYYSSNIFMGAGFTEHGADVATTLMGCMNVCITVLSLLLVDKLGRRPLHLAGLTGMCLCSALLVLSLAFRGIVAWSSYLSVLVLVLFVASFAVGPGSIPWFYASEIFTNNTRGRANSIAVMSNWMANFVVGLLFLPLKELTGSYSMLVFTVTLVLFIIFLHKYAPETKQKNFEDINVDMFSRAPFANVFTADIDSC